MSSEVFWWAGFSIFVLSMLILDLGVIHRTAHVVKMKEALLWCAVWISLALMFNVLIYFWQGPVKALEFLTGYLIEEALSVDNLFVFVIIFSYFRVDPLYQHRILFWGILGAIIMRAVFIAVGVTLINQFHWLIYLFGAFLIFAGIKMALQKDKEIHPEKNPVLKLFRRYAPVTDNYVGGSLFTRKDGRVLATPLFIVLLLLETTDLIFALDSIPAVLAITRDPFIVYTSNIFAILGLRSIFFALSGIIQMFQYLQYGLSVILVFVGVKMVLADVIKIPVGIALGVVAGILTVSVIASVAWPPKAKRLRVPVDPPEKKESSDSV
jgi:tellurite resistance protein TerC